MNKLIIAIKIITLTLVAFLLLCTTCDFIIAFKAFTSGGIYEGCFYTVSGVLALVVAVWNYIAMQDLLG